MKLFHRDLAPEIEALLEPGAILVGGAARVRERARRAALHAAGFSVVWDHESARTLEDLGARLARVMPSEEDQTWPEQRASLADGFARYALAVDLQTWGALRIVLDMGLESAKQRAEMRQILVSRGKSCDTLDALESVARLGGRAALLAYLKSDLGAMQ